MTFFIILMTYQVYCYYMFSKWVDYEKNIWYRNAQHVINQNRKVFIVIIYDVPIFQFESCMCIGHVFIYDTLGYFINTYQLST